MELADLVPGNSEFFPVFGLHPFEFFERCFYIGHALIPMNKDGEKFSPEEARKRMEAALRGARLVGHKPQSEMKLGKPRVKRAKSLKRKAPQKRG
jgi:hypothetical protein